MTTHILHIDSSLFGKAGVSATLTRKLVEQLDSTLTTTDIVHTTAPR